MTVLTHLKETRKEPQKETKSEAVLDAVRYLWLWLNGPPDHQEVDPQEFRCSQIYTAMKGADSLHFRTLAGLYPIEACAFIAWRNAPRAEEFFASHGIDPHRQIFSVSSG